ncbi:cache domain-containing sensor histidine kinase [Paenibacillus roseipurpureus]|uniref:Histidine kinase n=1 Tax=Paenibacillus roseopurpureus TaxID=2918901 RepID=A0AA96RLZ9_9BACL|nr:histidine kinase [Paenibacillus sp. MBLB1832]WNR45951.1 histidine kinase [Paenibacillus sp. MBLB1832]
MLRSFHSKLLALLIVISLVPMFIMSTYSYRVSVQAAEQNAGHSMETALEQMGKNLDFQVRTYRRYMDFFVSYNELKAVIFDNTFSPTSLATWVANRKLESMLNGLFLYEDSIASIAFYKNNELVYNYKELNGNTLRSFGKSVNYSEAMALRGGIQMSFLQTVNEENGSKENYYVFGRRLFKDQQVSDSTSAGVFIFVPEKNFADIFRTTNNPIAGSAWITDSNDHIYSRSDGEEDERLLPSLNLLSDLPQQSVRGSFLHEYEDRKFIVGYYRLDRWGLQIVQAIPQDVYTAKIRTIAKSTIWMSSILLVLLLLFSVSFAHKLSDPVRRMVSAMRQIQSGNFDVQLESNFTQEFNLLAKSFNYMAVRLKEQVIQLVAEEKRRGEIEYHMLQYQINPHFVNNTLGSVRLFAMTKGADEVAEVLHLLARLFQRTLGSSARLVRLRTELMHLKDYIRIHQMQYMDELQVSFQCDDELMEGYVPNMLLQPLVENALFHGIHSATGVPQITIGARKDAQDLILFVQDNGLGMSEDKWKEILYGGDSLSNRLNKIGVKNVDQRLQLHYGPAYGVSLMSKEGEGTRVEVRLPYQINMEEFEHEENHHHG